MTDADRVEVASRFRFLFVGTGCLVVGLGLAFLDDCKTGAAFVVLGSLFSMASVTGEAPREARGRGEFS